MFSQIIFPFFTALNCCKALDFENWHPPVLGDVRSPCPGLNALANHNILPHSGKGITAEMIIDATINAVNLSPEMAATVAKIGLVASPDSSQGTFDLDNLNKHNFLEHDGSLSRADYDLTGDNHSFNQSIFNTVLAHFEGCSHVNISAAALARWHRVTNERARNPKFMYGDQQMDTSYSESALYNMVLVDPQTGKVPVEFVKIFFEQERLPYLEGWRPPTAQVDTFSMSAMILRLALSTPETLSK